MDPRPLEDTQKLDNYLNKIDLPFDDEGRFQHVVFFELLYPPKSF
jgi:hypothetical protein